MEEDSIIWKIMNLSWIIFSFIFLLNGIGIIYAARKINKRSWLIEGIIYQVIPTSLLLLVMINPNSSFGVTLAGIYILSWIVCIIRTFFMASKYLDYLKANNNNQNIYNQNITQNPQINPNNYPKFDYQTNYDNKSSNVNNSKNSPNYRHIDSNDINNTDYSNNQGLDFNQNKNPYNTNLDYDNHSNFENQNIENQTDIIQNNNNFQKTENENNININTQIPTAPIDINTATIDEICNIPTINTKQAQMIINLRNEGKMISSLDDLKYKLNMDDTQISQIKEYIKISNINQNQRRIDL